jgi:hypothetical protein
LAIQKNLDQIAEQTHENANAITFWLDGNHYIGVTCESAAYALLQSLPVRKEERRATCGTRFGGIPYLKYLLATAYLTMGQSG